MTALTAVVVTFLVALNVQADPLEVLEKDGTFTQALRLFALAPEVGRALNVHKSFDLFAPSDDAFVRSARDLGLSAGTPKTAFEAMQTMFDDTTMKRLAMYHVVTDVRTLFNGTKPAETLLKGEYLTFNNDTKIVSHASKYRKPKLLETIANVDGIDVYRIDGLLFPSNGTSTEATVSDVPPSRKRNTTASPCFPAEVSVMLQHGNLAPMHALRAGDRVRTSELRKDVSQIFAFTHRVSNGTYEFIRIDTSGNPMSITLSESHYVYVNGIAVRADQVCIGDQLRTISGIQRVAAVGRVWSRGLYAPHTLQGDIVVGGIVASTYTALIPRDAAHALLAPVRALVRSRISKEPLGCLFYDGWPSWSHDFGSALMPVFYAFLFFCYFALLRKGSRRSRLL